MSHGAIVLQSHWSSVQVENMPKNHLKLLEKSMKETNWNAKIPEKARCVFHFGDTEGVEKAKTLQWDAFQESQVRSLPSTPLYLRH